MCLRPGAGFPDVLVEDHDAKFTSDVFHAFAKSMGSCLIVSLEDHTNTKELSNAADISKFPPPTVGLLFYWYRPPSPKRHTFALQRKMRCSPTVKVDRL